MEPWQVGAAIAFTILALLYIGKVAKKVGSCQSLRCSREQCRFWVAGTDFTTLAAGMPVHPQSLQMQEFSF